MESIRKQMFPNETSNGWVLKMKYTN